MELSQHIYCYLEVSIKFPKDLVLEITTIFYIPYELHTHCYLEVSIEDRYHLILEITVQLHMPNS